MFMLKISMRSIFKALSLHFIDSFLNLTYSRIELRTDAISGKMCFILNWSKVLQVGCILAFQSQMNEQCINTTHILVRYKK